MTGCPRCGWPGGPCRGCVVATLYDLAAWRSRASTALSLMDKPTIGDPFALWVISVGSIRRARWMLRAMAQPIPSRWLRLSDGRRLTADGGMTR